MSLRTTISLYSTSNVVLRCAPGSSECPPRISVYMRATRAGVALRPSRSGSSPTAMRISRTADSMRFLSTGRSNPGLDSFVPEQIGDDFDLQMFFELQFGLDFGKRIDEVIIALGLPRRINRNPPLALPFPNIRLGNLHFKITCRRIPFFYRITNFLNDCAFVGIVNILSTCP